MAVPSGISVRADYSHDLVVLPSLKSIWMASQFCLGLCESAHTQHR